MFDQPDDKEAPEDAGEPRREAAPDTDTAGQGDREDTDETTPEEAGYGYGV